MTPTHPTPPRQPQIFLCADWHLGHSKLVEMGVRPVGTEDRIIHHLVHEGPGKGDTLLNLGDVYLGKAGEELTRTTLAGLSEDGIRTVLVRGNHDSKRMGKLMNMGWDWICESTEILYQGWHCLFTHEPHPATGLVVNIHGHLHDLDGHRGSLVRDGNHILISSELLDYRPIPLQRVLQLGATPKFDGGRFVRAE